MPNTPVEIAINSNQTVGTGVPLPVNNYVGSTLVSASAPVPVNIIVGGATANVAVEGSGFSALKVTEKPAEYGALGHYTISALSGAIAAAATANTQVFYCRNSSASNLMVIQAVELEGMYATTAFAAGAIDLKLFVARSFTAENGTPGQTALTITGNNNKDRTSMATMSMAVVRIANTGTIADPTWTLDANPIGAVRTHSSGGVGAATPIIGSIYLPKLELFKVAGAQQHPIVLAQNEGIALTQSVPATGVWSFGIRVKWYETTSY